MEDVRGGPSLADLLLGDDRATSAARGRAVRGRPRRPARRRSTPIPRRSQPGSARSATIPRVPRSASSRSGANAGTSTSRGSASRPPAPRTTSTRSRHSLTEAGSVPRHRARRPVPRQRSLRRRSSPRVRLRVGVARERAARRGLPVGAVPDVLVRRRPAGRSRARARRTARTASVVTATEYDMVLAWAAWLVATIVDAVATGARRRGQRVGYDDVRGASRGAPRPFRRVGRSGTGELPGLTEVAHDLHERLVGRGPSATPCSRRIPRSRTRATGWRRSPTGGSKARDRSAATHRRRGPVGFGQDDRRVGDRRPPRTPAGRDGRAVLGSGLDAGRRSRLPDAVARRGAGRPVGRRRELLLQGCAGHRVAACGHGVFLDLPKRTVTRRVPSSGPHDGR